MTDTPLGRIVEIAENGRHLGKHRGFLTVSAEGNEIGRVPLDDLAAVIASAPGTTTSCVLLAELAERGIPFAVCGRNFAPAALLWPTETHHAQQRRMEAQLSASKMLADKLWAQVVASTIVRQGVTLSIVGARSGAFSRLARSVRPGDPENIEAQASRRYWPLMFGPDFRRDTNGGGVNSLLNYGYAVLRAATARAIAAAGLHPGLGIFHRHPHNMMPLADDLMEPFRPEIDLTVHRLIGADVSEVDPDAKRTLVDALAAPLAMERSTSPLSTTLMRLGQSLAESYMTGVPSLHLPGGRVSVLTIDSGSASDPG
jgi:CRISPR-associated protein Cas1